jgi:Zn-dependent M16 (insulinase) family peptidase
VKRASGEDLTHEEVVNQLDDETVSYEVNLGFAGMFSELARVSIKVEEHRYATAVAWLHDLLFGSRFDRERLQVAVAKIQQSLPELKRDGNTVLGAVTAEQLYTAKSTSKASAVLDQIEFIPKIAEALKENPAEVIEKFEQIRSHSKR